MATITSSLGEDELKTAGTALQQTLVDLIDLSLVAKQAHWTLTGKRFRSVHLQLDELVTAARGFADDVAERAATIGVPPDGRARTVVESSGMSNWSSGWKTDHDVIEGITDDLSNVIQRLRARIDETDKTDLVTQDLLITIAHELEKSHWMWQAQLSGS